MKKISLILMAALLVWSVNCSSVSVNYDYDPRFDFSQLKTYDWISVKVPEKGSELRMKRAMIALENALAAKGYMLAQNNPDFLIALHGFSETKVNVTTYGYGYGPYYGWGRWGVGYVDVNTYEQGTFFVDFVDSKSKELVWRGIAQGAAEPNLSPKEQEEKFAYVAEKMLKNFPPTK